MSKGHSITLRSESYDFYLFDPHATSDEDLLTPSSDSLFHVRSRISGHMMSFLSLEAVKEDPHYLSEVKTSLGEVVRHGGRDDDIAASLPNMEIISTNPQLNFEHLLDDSLIRDNKRNNPNLSDDIDKIKAQPIGRFINRHHYATTLATPISRLHANERGGILNEKDYRDVMQEVNYLMESDETPGYLKASLGGLRHFWNPSRVLIGEGGVTFLDSSGMRLSPYGSENLKRSFFEQIRDAMQEALNKHPNNDVVLRFGSLLNRISGLGYNGTVMDKIMANLTGNLPDNLPSGERHPAVIAAARMAVGDNPYLSHDDILASPALNPEITQRYEDTQYGVSPHANMLRRLCQASSHERQRNIFQVGERMNWCTESVPSFGSDKSSLFKSARKELFWQNIEENKKPLNKLLREMLAQNNKLATKEDGRPLSKRMVNLYLANVQTIDKIQMHFKAGKHCEPATLYTDSGERIVVSFDTPRLPVSQVRHSAKSNKLQGRVTYYDKDNTIVFDHQGNLDTENGYSNRRFDFKSILTDPLHVLHLPPGKITDFPQFRAVVGCMANNRTLSSMMGDGYLRHLDQERDDQGRKVSRKDYQSWIDVVIPRASKLDDLSKFSDDTYLKDSDNIAEDISRSLLLHLANASGIKVGSQYTASDMGSGTDIDKDEAFTFDGINVDATVNLSLIDLRMDRINYKKDMIDVADKLHNVGATLVKSHMPTVDVEWESSTDTIALGMLPDGTRVHAEPLHSYAAIQRHGSTMRHCAGTYASLCMAGDYYLWAIMGTSPDGTQQELSTLGMHYVISIGNHVNGDCLEFDQHFSQDNAPVTGPLNEMVTRFSESLQVASKGHVSDIDDNHYGYDDENDRVDYDSEYSPPYDVDFERTSYDGRDDDLTSEDVAEIIANYHWQGEDFGRDAMDLLSRIYGESAIKEALVVAIDMNIDDLRDNDEAPDDLLSHLKDMRQRVMTYTNEKERTLDA